jgi:hypothetical protein
MAAMHQRTRSFIIFLSLILLLFGISNFGPRERSLGIHVRLVYLHGAWVWTALIGFASAAISGVAGFLRRDQGLHQWSVALGRAALFYWITYLPLSLITMQLNWNGLFLEEPRWRIGLDFAIVGLLFQAAVALLRRPSFGSGVNIAFMLSLAWSLLRAEQVMHPSSPIRSSTSLWIQLFFFSLTLLCLLSGYFLTRWIRKQFQVAK